MRAAREDRGRRTSAALAIAVAVAVTGWARSAAADPTPTPTPSAVHVIARADAEATLLIVDPSSQQATQLCTLPCERDVDRDARLRVVIDGRDRDVTLREIAVGDRVELAASRHGAGYYLGAAAMIAGGVGLQVGGATVFAYRDLLGGSHPGGFAAAGIATVVAGIVLTTVGIFRAAKRSVYVDASPVASAPGRTSAGLGSAALGFAF